MAALRCQLRKGLPGCGLFPSFKFGKFRQPNHVASKAASTCARAASPSQSSSRSFSSTPRPTQAQRRTQIRIVPKDPLPPPQRFPGFGNDRQNGGYQYFENRRGQKLYTNPRFWKFTGVAGALGGVYYVMHLEPVPVSNRKRFMNVSPETEMLMAKQAYEQVLQQFRHRILPPNHPYSIFVRKVARNLIKVSGLEDLKWEVHVVDDPQKNAFVLPGGKIFVFTGLLPIVEDEAGMAAVLGHEIAHQVARHSAEKLSYMTITTILQLLLAALFDPNMVLTRIFVEFGINMPFSRKMESEADYIGLRLMAQACYDPNAAVRMWQRMKEVVNHSEVMAYLGTHPSPGKRIENIKEWLPEAQLIRENSDCYQMAPVASRFRHFDRPIW